MVNAVNINPVNPLDKWKEVVLRMYFLTQQLGMLYGMEPVEKIEYYNGDVLYDYQCIKLGRPGRKTPLWNALQFDSPTSEIFEAPEQKYALILAECNSMAEAENFLKQKDSYPVVILPFNNNGKVLVGKMFYNKSYYKKMGNYFVV